MVSIPLERHKRICRRLVMDFFTNISTRRDGLCRDGLCLQLSPKLHDLSPFASATFFYDMCPRLSLQTSFGKSCRNGIWALLVTCYHMMDGQTEVTLISRWYSCLQSVIQPSTNWVQGTVTCYYVPHVIIICHLLTFTHSLCKIHIQFD